MADNIARQIFDGTPIIFGLSSGQLLSAGLVLYSANLYMRHLRQMREGRPSMFQMQGGYKNLTPMKHDIIKTLVAELIPMLLLTANASQLFDFSDPVNNIVSKIALTSAYYMVFYHYVEPYLANATAPF
jgi:hypothetical protein